MQEIKKIAKAKGLIFHNAGKTTIIRSIQRAEGLNDCFATSRAKECEENCFWKKECFAYIQEG